MKIIVYVLMGFLVIGCSDDASTQNRAVEQKTQEKVETKAVIQQKVESVKKATTEAVEPAKEAINKAVEQTKVTVEKVTKEAKETAQEATSEVKEII